MLGQALLAVVALYVGAIVWRGRTFRIRVSSSAQRTRSQRMTAWALGLGVSFGIPAVLGLLLLGQDPLAAFQPEAIAVMPGDWALLPTGPLLFGMALGTIANAGITHWRWRRGKRAFQIGNFPDILPESRGALIPAIGLSISAGVSEELFFRLFLPLLVALVFGNAWVGLVIGTAAFGAVHRYQGVRGVVATTLVGAGLSAIYAVTGALWMAIAFHVVIDLNALVVRPLARGAWRA